MTLGTKWELSGGVKSGNTSMSGRQDSTSTTDEDSTTTGSQKTSLDFDAATKDYLDKILASTQYSKNAAITDSSNAASWAMQKSLELGMPGISSAAKSAGGYNSSAQEMLTNDLSARAQGVGSTVMLDTITKYAAAQASQVQAATGAVATTTGRTANSLQRTIGTKTTNESSTKSANTGSTEREAKGGLGGITVICTQLYLDKHISLATYQADTKYVRKHFSTTTQRGYRFWAVPLVRLMRRNSTAYAITKYFGVRWSLHCASYYRMDTAPNWIGRILIGVAVPICYCIGTVVQEVPFLRPLSGD